MYDIHIALCICFDNSQFLKSKNYV
uniref:Uncharacterized protein n=1 Tax=Arundo donax TaxID=35708 RepID=A0A0A8Z3D4_ARUDO